MSMKIEKIKQLQESQSEKDLRAKDEVSNGTPSNKLRSSTRLLTFDDKNQSPQGNGIEEILNKSEITPFQSNNHLLDESRNEPKVTDFCGQETTQTLNDNLESEERKVNKESLVETTLSLNDR